MTYSNEAERLEAEEWRDAVSREYHRHADHHAISVIRAKQFIHPLADIVEQVGVTGAINALGNALIEALARKDGLPESGDPHLTWTNANRVKRFATTLRRRQAADDAWEDALRKPRRAA